MKWLKSSQPRRLRTHTDSVIKRYQDNVGKMIGDKLYVHKDYANEVIPNVQQAVAQLPKDFNYNTVMYDQRNGYIRFDEAPDFDTAREPRVGNSIKVYDNGEIKEGHSNSIWHHKWLWVKDDYNGFDVDESFEWSKEWLGVFEETAKGTERTWNEQLERYNL